MKKKIEYSLNNPLFNSESSVIKTIQLKQKSTMNNRFLVVLLSCFTILTFLPTTVSAENRRHFYAEGRAATGINDLCGEPIFSLDVPAGFNPNFHARVVAEYDPNGELPIPLTPDNCDEDIVLATYTELGFLMATGQPDIDIRLKNIPLKQVPVISAPDGTRSALPSLSNVPGNAFPPTKSEPNDAITLGNWLNARGQMHLTCRADGTAKIKLRYRNLVPNGLYSVWALWNTIPPGVNGGRIVPLPLGGLPNVIVPDLNGRATFIRELASCPKDITPDGSIVMFIDLAFHSDNNLSGAFPQIALTPTMFKGTDGELFSSPLVAGAVTHDHVLFLISGEEL